MCEFEQKKNEGLFKKRKVVYSKCCCILLNINPKPVIIQSWWWSSCKHSIICIYTKHKCVAFSLSRSLHSWGLLYKYGYGSISCSFCILCCFCVREKYYENPKKWNRNCNGNCGGIICILTGWVERWVAVASLIFHQGKQHLFWLWLWWCCRACQDVDDDHRRLMSRPSQYKQNQPR